MSPKTSVNPPFVTNGENRLAAFRAWLMDGHDPDGLVAGQPLPLWLLDNGWLDAVDEAWAAGADADARDARGRNWLHRAVVLEPPTWLALEGLRRMGDGWWQPDDTGHTPFHLPVADARLAQAMVVRWWSEQRSWRLLCRPFDPMGAQLPQARAWRAWKDLLRA